MAYNTFPFLDDEKKRKGAVVPPASSGPPLQRTLTPQSAPPPALRRPVTPSPLGNINSGKVGGALSQFGSPYKNGGVIPQNDVPQPSPESAAATFGRNLAGAAAETDKIIGDAASSAYQAGMVVPRAIANAAVDVHRGLAGVNPPAAAPNGVVFAGPGVAAPSGFLKPAAAAGVPTGANTGAVAKPVRPDAGPVDMGTYRTTAAGAQPVNVPTATSISGRNLGYGQIINGVRTFSDGSGTGGIPRTMADTQIADLGNRANVADPGALPAAAAIRRPLPSAEAANAATLASQADAARASDIASIATSDPRSPLGIAARRLKMDAQYADRADKRQAAQANLAALTNSAAAQGQNGVALASDLAQGAQRETGANARNLSDNATRLTEANINRPRPQLIQQGDGTFVTLDDSGTVARPLVGAGGQPVRGLTPKSEGAVTPRDRLNAYVEESKGLNSILDEKQRAEAADELRNRYADVLGGAKQAGVPKSADDFIARARAAGATESDDELRAYFQKKQQG